MHRTPLTTDKLNKLLSIEKHGPIFAENEWCRIGSLTLAQKVCCVKRRENYENCGNLARKTTLHLRAPNSLQTAWRKSCDNAETSHYYRMPLLSHDLRYAEAIALLLLTKRLTRARKAGSPSAAPVLQQAQLVFFLFFFLFSRTNTAVLHDYFVAGPCAFAALGPTCAVKARAAGPSPAPTAGPKRRRQPPKWEWLRSRD